MASILSYIIFGLSIISLMLGISYLKDNKNNKINKCFFLTTLGSLIWGLGFGFLLIQTNEVNALYCRSFGMIGVFIYAIFGVKVFTLIANISDDISNLISFISYFGLILFPFVIMPERQTFHMEYFGMSYTFANDIWNTIYNLYNIAILALFLILLIKMRKNAQLKRQIVFNNKLWLFFITFLAGTILDTLLPILGVAAFPGSTLSQFFAIYIVYYSLIYEKKNSLSLENISDHLYHSIEMPILVLNQDKKIEFISDSAYNYFRIKKQDNINIEDLLIIQNENDLKNLFEKDLNGEFLVNKSNSYCSVTIEKVKDTYNDIVGYIMLVTDLTEKNNFIIELEKAKEIAEEASKSKDNFLANMSHEIRTPLNAIMGVNDLLYTENRLPKIKEYSKQIELSSKSLLGIVNDIFAFSKIQSGKMELNEENYDLKDVINYVIEKYKDEIKEKNLEFDISIDKSIPNQLYGDEKRIRQCIINLLKNAIKYTNEGSISINVYAELINSKKANIVIEVSDTGIGIKEEDINKIFTTFSGLEKTNNRTFEGTGLGLTIVKRLINLMSGSLQIQSEYGTGSTFILNFPQTIVEETEKTPNPEIINELELPIEKENNDNHKKFNPKTRLLVVDDNKINLMILKEFLLEYGVKVDGCLSGTEALQKCDENSYDMIFLDHMMPGMDGIETLNQIKIQSNNKNKNIPIIVVTANAIEGANEYYLEKGFDDYISKPIDTDLLEKILFKYLPEELLKNNNTKK